MDDKPFPSVYRYMSDRIFDADMHTRLVGAGFDGTPREVFTVIDVMKYHSKMRFSESIMENCHFGTGRNGRIW